MFTVYVLWNNGRETRESSYASEKEANDLAEEFEFDNKVADVWVTFTEGE